MIQLPDDFPVQSLDFLTPEQREILLEIHRQFREELNLAAERYARDMADMRAEHHRALLLEIERYRKDNAANYPD